MKELSWKAHIHRYAIITVQEGSSDMFRPQRQGRVYTIHGKKVCEQWSSKRRSPSSQKESNGFRAMDLKLFRESNGFRGFEGEKRRC